MARHVAPLRLPRSTAAHRLRRAHPYFAGTVIAIGLVVLAGWALGNDALKSVVPGMISMKVNTAFSLIVLAVGLLALNAHRAVRRAIVPVCCAVVAVLALMTLSEYAFGVDLRIDNLVFYDHVSTQYPGRNAPATNVALLGLVVALMLLHVRQAVTFAQTLLFFVAAAPLTAIGGYLYHAPGMYQNAPYPTIALNTAAALMLLCFGALSARADEALMGIVTSRSTAGSLARKLLPAAIGLPLLTGLLVLAGQRADLYTGAFGAALLVACCAIFFAGAACWSVTVLWKTDLLRATAEREREHLLAGEREARGEAERANRIKDEFLSVVSHELRTPLNAILGWSQILRGGDGVDVAQGLEVIERNGRAQKQIIEDLLDMSRIISGKVRLEVKRVDLPVLIQAVIQSMQPAADAKGVRLQAEIDPRIDVVAGDPGRLQQVVWNLLSNAIKFTPKGGRVRVLAERLSSAVDVRVIDTGEGIPPDVLPFVFDRFRQADASTTRRHGGLGLGLSIVKQLVELHGGAVRAMSDGKFRGATFVVELPLESPLARPGSASRTHSGDTLDAAPDIAGLSVLVVDDEPDARLLVKLLLEQRDATVVTAGSADEAVVLVQGHAFDVLVSDIGMPVEDGYMLIRRVRDLDHAAAAIPAIALTAYARAEDRQKSAGAGFQFHLAKPVEPAELIALIAQAVGRVSAPA